MASLDATTQARLQRVRDRIDRAAAAAGRDPRAIALVAVGKTFGAERIEEAIAAGQRSFGENYLQEALAKIRQVGRTDAGRGVEWHFIGPIQSNKARDLALYFDWIQTIDRLAIAQRLSAQRPTGATPPLNVLLQINISGEPTKHGVAPAQALELARQVVRLPRLRLRGLMAIPEPAADLLGQRAPFARMRNLLGELQQGLGEAGPGLDTLSMGMSEDLEAAILEGSTMVRIGTAIFGARTP